MDIILLKFSPLHNHNGINSSSVILPKVCHIFHACVSESPSKTEQASTFIFNSSNGKFHMTFILLKLVVFLDIIYHIAFLL